MSEKTTLHVDHAFLYIYLHSLYNYVVKWPNFKYIWKGNGKGINSTICVWTRARCLFLRSNPNSLLLSNWAPWNNRENKWCEVCFLETFSWTSPLSDRNVPIKPQRRWDAKKRHFLESKGLRGHWRPWSSSTPTLKPAYIYNMFQCS